MFFGTIKLVGFVLVFLLKSERNMKKMAIESEREKMEELYDRIEHNTIAKAYKGIITLFRVKPMAKLIFVFLTIRVIFFFNSLFV